MAEGSWYAPTRSIYLSIFPVDISTLALLPTRHWATDNGLRRCLNNLPGEVEALGDYYQWQKADKTLLELIKYQDAEARQATLAYFGLPVDTRPFLDWVFAWAAYQHRGELPAGVEQDDVFPYPQLYLVWQLERVPRRSNLLVYRNRICDTDGRELLAFASHN